MSFRQLRANSSDARTQEAVTLPIRGACRENRGTRRLGCQEPALVSRRFVPGVRKIDSHPPALPAVKSKLPVRYFASTGSSWPRVFPIVLCPNFSFFPIVPCVEFSRREVVPYSELRADRPMADTQGVPRGCCRHDVDVGENRRSRGTPPTER